MSLVPDPEDPFRPPSAVPTNGFDFPVPPPEPGERLVGVAAGLGRLYLAGAVCVALLAYVLGLIPLAGLVFMAFGYALSFVVLAVGALCLLTTLGVVLRSHGRLLGRTHALVVLGASLLVLPVQLLATVG